MQGQAECYTSPAGLNAVPDAVLEAYVQAVVHGAERPRKLAGFITMSVLLRVNNMVVDAVGTAGTKQATLCRVVQSITGRSLEKDDRDAQTRSTTATAWERPSAITHRRTRN
mmetsp:Transcript_1971/g.4968  ORF Transcript_1971/g.4968 Transcript_1971/m.4968 type:complete len:112 (-) Transcript_1971:536-871(-)